MAMVKATFLLLVEDNDGRDLGEQIDAAVDLVYHAFGGWTWEGTVTAAFRMPDGTQKTDSSERYMVFFDSGRIGELEVILRRFKAATTQEAIFLEIQREVDIRLL